MDLSEQPAAAVTSFRREPRSMPAHKHPHEQFVWMVKGTMDFRIGNDKRTMKPGDVAVIPGGVEHEGYFTEDSEVIDFFAPVREDFLSGAPPSYMRAS